jgi:hypothetical protein
MLLLRTMASYTYGAWGVWAAGSACAIFLSSCVYHDLAGLAAPPPQVAALLSIHEMVAALEADRRAHIAALESQQVRVCQVNFCLSVCLSAVCTLDSTGWLCWSCGSFACRSIRPPVYPAMRFDWTLRPG